MTRHSKNSCSGSVFTYNERHNHPDQQEHRKLGIQKSLESMRPIDTCTFCMKRSFDMVFCSASGHVGCRECFLNAILQQRRNNKKRKLSSAAQSRITTLDKGHDESEFLRQQTLFSNDNSIFGTNSPSSALFDKRARGSYSYRSEDSPTDTTYCIGEGSPRLSLSSLVSVVPKYIDDILVCYLCDRAILKEAKIVKKCGHLLCNHCSQAECACGCKDELNAPIFIKTQ